MISTYLFLDLGNICFWNICSGKAGHGCGKVIANLPLNSLDFPTSLVAHHTLYSFIQRILIECYYGPTYEYYSIGMTFHSQPEGT